MIAAFEPIMSDTMTVGAKLSMTHTAAERP
jgi:hypothetical protein